jgi:hypothetical protein
VNISEIKEKLREKRDIIIIVLTVIVVLLLIVIGTRMQKDRALHQRAEEEASRPPEKVTLAPKTQAGEEGQGSSQSTATTYFLHPSPEEMLALIRDLGQAQLPQQNQKYAGFSVMWPCYFFQVLKEEGGRATVLFDVSEDGFGATIVTDIDTTRFPEIRLTERGKKVWLAGEIIGVDPTGTGTIHIVSDEIRFEEGLMDAVDGTGRAVQPAAEPSAPQKE